MRLLIALLLVANVAWADDDAYYAKRQREWDRYDREQERKKQQRELRDYRMNEEVRRDQELFVQQEMLEEMRKANRRARDRDGALSFERD